MRKLTGEIRSNILFFVGLVGNIKNKGSFVQNVSYNSLGYIVLFGSQLLFTPLISRLYSPEVYGLFSTILAMATNIATVSSLRMETLVYIEKDQSKRDFIVKFLCGTSFYLTLLLMLGCLVVYNLPGSSKGILKSPYIFFFPVLMYLQVVYSYSGAEVTNAKAFKQVFIWGVPATLFSKLYTLIYGLLSRGNVLGLLSSEIIAKLFYIPVLVKVILRKKLVDYFYHARKDVVRGISLIKEYKRFPLYELPISYLNVITSQIHIYILAFLNQKQIIGWIGMAFTVMDAPTRLLGYSIQPVLIQKCSETLYDKRKLSHVLNKVLYFITFIALFPFLGILFWGPGIFSWALGAKWLMAGKLASAFSVFYFFKMEFEILDAILSVMQLQAFKFRVFVINNILRILSIIIAVYIVADPFTAIIYWSVFNAFAMLVSLAFIYRKLNLSATLLVLVKFLLLLFLAIRVLEI